VLDMTNLIGIDQSIAHTVVCTASGPKRIDTAPQDFSHETARLQHISEHFAEAVAPIAPGWAYIEGYGFGTDMAHTLGELGGQLKLELYGLGWVIVVVPPSTLKKFTSGSGATKKDGMRMHVLKRWGYESVDDNDSDAFALRAFGEMHQRHLRGEHVTKADAASCAAVLTYYPAHLAHLQPAKVKKARKKKRAPDLAEAAE
jgi:Holliday junction resolvasome RuvABC endonuclease subunit